MKTLLAFFMQALLQAPYSPWYWLTHLVQRAGRDRCFARKFLLDQSLQWERLWSVSVKRNSEELLSNGMKEESRFPSLDQHSNREGKQLLKLHKKLHKDLKSLKAAMEMQKGLSSWQRLQSWMELARQDEARGGKRLIASRVKGN